MQEGIVMRARLPAKGCCMQQAYAHGGWAQAMTSGRTGDSRITRAAAFARRPAGSGAGRRPSSSAARDGHRAGQRSPRGTSARRASPRGGSSASVSRPAGRERVLALDGIRALAILAIIIYHAHARWLPAGFLGVTVFFVISGYLVTSGLIRELERSGTIDFKNLFVRRLRRLFPTMLVVVLVIALLTAVFAPELLRKMRPDVLPSLLFFDNWWYIIRKLSYFEAAGAPSPLTHFWYLGVIGQFYIVWPFVIMLLDRVCPTKTAMRRVVAALGIISSLMMVIMFDPNADPSRVYYGTDTRLGELMVGSWLAFVCPLGGYEIPQKERLGIHADLWVELIGVGALVLLFVFCRVLNGYSKFLFRGGYLLIAMLTGLLLASVVGQRGYLGKALGVAPLKVVGDRSYQLYLWHYPLLLMMNPATRTVDVPWWGWVLEFALIIVISEVSYRAVERTTASGQIGEFFRGVRSGEISISGLFEDWRVPLRIASGLVALSVLLMLVGPFWSKSQAGQQGNAGDQATVEAGVTVHPTIPPLEDGSPVTDLNILLIGDSVAEGCEVEFYQRVPNGHLDAVINRQLSAGPELYQQNESEGNGGDIVVFALGTNGVATEKLVRANIEAVGDKPVFLVNIRTPEQLQDINNDLYAEIVPQYPNAHLIDWYSESANHSDWFWDDGTHPRPEGSAEYINMIVREVSNVVYGQDAGNQGSGEGDSHQT